MLCEADTIGVFQVESRAQMATLPRLGPATFYDIVVQVAIIRPGPIVGQMVHPYLNRRAGREPVVYAHPSLEPILARTLGVPLFQEQLLRIAMVAAGFTGGQAEELRRAFGFKRSERRMKQVEVQLREGMARTGITGDAAEQIIASITSFALYGFPESHAASFALLAYASAYLKAHYPAAFYTALLNNQPMGFYHPSTLVKDAQRRGVRFHPIDVQVSDWECTVESDGAIRLGLRYVSGLREQAGKAVAAPRSKVAAPGGPERRALSRSPVLDTREHYGASAQAWGPGIDLPEMRLRRSIDDRGDRRPWPERSRGPIVLQCLLARMAGADGTGAPLRIARRSRRAHRLAARRSGDARRYRRAEFVRVRPPIRTVAGREGGAPLRGALRQRGPAFARRRCSELRRGRRIRCASFGAAG